MAGLIVIGGPTGSGKSALALALAEALDGIVVNGDSMQLYRELRILSARPSPEDEARVPHRLFGVLGGDQPGSVGLWLELAAGVLAEAQAAGRIAIVVGGTGLYLEALLGGIAAVPEIPGTVRRTVRERYGALADDALHAALLGRDPAMAARVRPSDRQRLLRALEVHLATGRSLAHFQAAPRHAIALPQPVAGLALLPPRADLYARIERRLQAMVAAGALGELEALAARRLDPDLPVMKALAVRELMDHLAGRLSLDEALARAATATRHYAKRQLTWFRHRLPELQRVSCFGDDASGLGDPARLGRRLLTGRTLPHSVRSDRATRPGLARVGSNQPRNDRGTDR